MILDEKMDDSVEYGDLVITKNVDTNTLKIGDLVAFRNASNTVTIHKIIEIVDVKEIDEKTEEEKTTKKFMMQTRENETNSTKSAKENKIEGIVKNRIPKLGLVVIFIQQPISLAIIIGIILIIGGIALLIAKKLDERDQKSQNQSKN